MRWPGRAAQTGRVRPDPASQRARTWPAALTLFVLAGLIPETVATFNSPPRLLLARPAALLFICAFYGSVALLVREYMRRRAPGWTGVLLLGAAAGAVNEGIIAGTWYKVQYPGYALVGGFDPAVAVGLTVFHALVSTVLTILLVEIILPDVAAAPWLRRPGVRGCLLLLAVATASGFGSAADRDRKVVVLAGVVAAVTAALSLAGRGNSAPMTSLRPAPGIGRLRLAGAAAMVTFYALFAAVPGLIEAGIPPAARGPWQLVPVLLMAGFCWEVVSVGRDWAGRPGWAGRRRWRSSPGSCSRRSSPRCCCPRRASRWSRSSRFPCSACWSGSACGISRPRA